MPRIGGGGPAGRISIKVTGDFTQGRVKLRSVKNQLRNVTKPLKQATYEFMETSVKERFLAGGKPRWAKRKVDKPWPLLIKTGKLMNSVTSRYSRNKDISHPTPRSVILSSKVSYAIYHDKERAKVAPNKNIYGRPFLYLTESDKEIYVKYLNEWTVRAIRKAGIDLSTVTLFHWR